MPGFKTITIDSEQIIGDEALGTKEKFWIEHEGEAWLFKAARANTGEDWSEKLAAEIAHLLNIPAAHIELAAYKGRPGTISRSFVNKRQGEDLIHGNEVLGGQAFGYNPEQRWGQTRHTIENIAKAIKNLFPETADASKALQQLASYMLLDGLIGNAMQVDRHHENWGLLATWDTSCSPPALIYSVAPSFDDASSLGRELLEVKIQQKLDAPQGIANYVSKGRGAIYIEPKAKRGANPLYLVEQGLKHYPEYFIAAVESLKGIALEHIIPLVDNIPKDRIRSKHVEFVKQFIHYTYQRLCNSKP